MQNEFSKIAAYEGRDIVDAVDRILNDRDFLRWVKRTSGRTISPRMRRFVVKMLGLSKNPLRWIDSVLVYPFMRYLIKHTTTALTLSCQPGQPAPGAFYITNHRDIILDAGFLSYLLRIRYGIRPYLGVGNNLFGQPWIEDLMRINRAFAVVRNCSPHDLLPNAQLLSDYIANRREAGESFWLAQREGRAKDSNDTTQPAVLKMLTLSEEGSLIDALCRLNLTPVAITYEFDPCDYLKAKEMQLKRDDPNYKKTAKEDMLNMQTGLKGQKGDVSFQITPCINDELRLLDANLSRNELLREAAAIIDKHIHQGYQLAWTNKAAMDIVNGKPNEKMEAYIASRIQLIDIPNRDDAFLRQCILTMYANPAINQNKANNE